jgi:beta-lactamase regulating signal transducer with metallopeptidase domain
MTMDVFFLKLLNMSISALWVVLAVVVLRLLLRRAPKWIRVLLWAAVGLRLVLPEIPVSDLSLMPSAETLPPDIIYAARPAIHSGVPVINAVVNPVLGESLAATPQFSMNPIQKWLVVACLVWLVGMVAMVVYAFISWLRIRLRVRESVQEGGVWLCDRIPAPFILGIFRPRIYLPSDLKAEDRPFVLAHERAHLSRKDHWWKPLGFALLTVHWFNPALWLAYILLCRDIEAACGQLRRKAIEDRSEGKATDGDLCKE